MISVHGPTGPDNQCMASNNCQISNYVWIHANSMKGTHTVTAVKYCYFVITGSMTTLVIIQFLSRSHFHMYKV